jgi:hypothetical protein
MTTPAPRCGIHAALLDGASGSMVGSRRLFVCRAGREARGIVSRASPWTAGRPFTSRSPPPKLKQKETGADGGRWSRYFFLRRPPNRIRCVTVVFGRRLAALLGRKRPLTASRTTVVKFLGWAFFRVRAIRGNCPLPSDLKPHAFHPVVTAKVLGDPRSLTERSRSDLPFSHRRVAHRAGDGVGFRPRPASVQLCHRGRRRPFAVLQSCERVAAPPSCMRPGPAVRGRQLAVAGPPFAHRCAYPPSRPLAAIAPGWQSLQ